MKRPVHSKYFNVLFVGTLFIIVAIVALMAYILVSPSLGLGTTMSAHHIFALAGLMVFTMATLASLVHFFSQLDSR